MDNSIINNLKKTDVLKRLISSNIDIKKTDKICVGNSDSLRNNFIESELYQAPSYKFNEQGQYKLIKNNDKNTIRLPGFADRIFTSVENTWNNEFNTQSIPNSYNCLFNIHGSDHKAVSQKYKFNIRDKKINVYCLTWNVAELDLVTVNDKLNTDFQRQNESDILIYCFQEVNSTINKNILFKSPFFNKYTLITEENTKSGFKLLICLLFKKDIVGNCITNDCIEILDNLPKIKKHKTLFSKIGGQNMLEGAKLIRNVTSEIKKHENNLLYLNLFKCQNELFKGARFINCKFSDFNFVICNVHLPFKSESKTLKAMLLVNERINQIRNQINNPEFLGFLTMGDFNSRSTFVPGHLDFKIKYDKKQQKLIPVNNIIELENSLNTIIVKRPSLIAGKYTKKLTKKRIKHKKKGGNWRLKLGHKDTEADKKVQYFRDLRNNAETKVGIECARAREMKEYLEKQVESGNLKKEIKDPNKSILNLFRELVDNPVYIERNNKVISQLEKCNKLKTEFNDYDLKYLNAKLEKESKKGGNN